MSWMQVWKCLGEFLFSCLPAYLLPAFSQFLFLKQFENVISHWDAFMKGSFIYLLLTTYVFINVQLLYSKITSAQNLLSLSEEEGSGLIFETYIFGVGSQIMQLCSLRFMAAVVQPGGAKAAKWQDNYWKGRPWGGLSVLSVKSNQVTQWRALSW